MGCVEPVFKFSNVFKIIKDIIMSRSIDGQLCWGILYNEEYVFPLVDYCSCDDEMYILSISKHYYSCYVDQPKIINPDKLKVTEKDTDKLKKILRKV